MNQPVAFEHDVDLLDADHKAVNTMSQELDQLDLRGMTLPLLRPRLQLKKQTDTTQVKESA
jgi:hypothetical protein